MINPTQIRSHTFDFAKKGTYKADEVDAFLEEIAIDIEKSFLERQELVEKITLLADRLQKYKNAQKPDDVVNQKVKLIEEKAIEKAKEIISAAGNKKAEILADAQSEHDNIVNSAVNDAKLKVSEIEKELENKKNELEATKKFISDFKTNALNLYESHIAGLNTLPSFEKENVVTDNEVKESSFKVNFDSFNKDNDFSDFFGGGKNNK